MGSVVTRRMVLRPWTQDDRDVWRELASNDVVLAHIDNGNAAPQAEIDAQLANASNQLETPNLFACELLDEPGSPIGLVRFVAPPVLRQPIPGYRMDWRFLPGHWGNGYATEAITGALSWAFEHDLFDEIVACIQPANRRAVAVALKLGMASGYRTVTPEHQRWIDVYQLHRDRWDGGL